MERWPQYCTHCRTAIWSAHSECDIAIEKTKRMKKAIEERRIRMRAELLMLKPLFEAFNVQVTLDETALTFPKLTITSKELGNRILSDE